MTRLATLETALPDGRLHWTGGERLRDMARRLSADQRDPERRRRPGG